MNEDPIEEVRALRERLGELESRLGTDGAAEINAAIRRAAGRAPSAPVEDRPAPPEPTWTAAPEPAPPTDMNALIRQAARRGARRS